jgi:hypothetical protein
MDQKKQCPWATIWFSPRQTIERIVEGNRRCGLHLLAFLYGFAFCLGLARSMFLGVSYSPLFIFIASAVLAWPVGYGVLSISSILFYWIGKWFKGSATYCEVKAAIFWSNAPVLISVITWIALVAYFGGIVFTQEFMVMHASKGQLLFAQSVSLIQIIMGVWGIIIFLSTYSQVEGFSRWTAFFSGILATLLWFILLIMCVLVTYVLLKSMTIASLFI